MKVCTDACLFAAWIASKIENEKWHIENILDVGAGTGLLSLMLTQKTAAKIDAVEIDASAAQQAIENFATSPWKNRLTVIEGDIKNIKLPRTYDFIISNPPFFAGDLKSENQQRNLALHSEALNLEELITATLPVLNANGLIAVLLPYHRTSLFIKIVADSNLFLKEQVLVKQTENHPFFRSMLIFSRTYTSVAQSEITIKKEGKYTDEFLELLKDYYLKL